MFSLLISLVATTVIVGGLLAGGAHTGTTIFFGILGFLAAYILVGFLVRKKVTGVQKELQEIMLAGQQRIGRKIQQVQMKPGANIKLVQKQIEADQKKIYQDAIAFVDRMEPFRKWSPLMGRQIATMRMQFHYQLKEFEQVDELLATQGLFKGPLMMEPMTVAMKMARQYKHDDIEGAEKTFKRHIKWFRGSRGTLLYGLMSWILVKQGKTEEARTLLQKGMEATGDETLSFNWERLSNDKVKSFSNAGLGEEWYGLYLENPPAPKQQRVRAQKAGRRPF
ncbi:MAG: hypothetical protein JXR25_14215 [Pontiellaceae bacterium]|nr:hypothetical protein [Pontiellaceae bacterium]MBN2785973.1 hypothetical protein [Pontiellaceae bacterium]